jgi:hypothetical protein
VPFAVFTDALEHHLRSSPEAGVESLQDDQLALLAIVFPVTGLAHGWGPRDSSAG